MDNSLAVTRYPSLLSIPSPPRDAAVREEIGSQIWSGLCERFKSQLVPREVLLFDKPPNNPDQDRDYAALVRRFDNFLLGQFAELGWLLFMSGGVLQRISEWQRRNPALLEQMGKCLSIRAKVYLGEKSAPFPEGIEQFADSAINELTLLLRRKIDTFGAQRRSPTCSEIAEWLKAEVESGNDFPCLKANSLQLYGFVKNLPENNAVSAKSLERGELRARGFFYLWYSVASNRSLRDIRNEISRRRRSRHSS